MQSVESTLIVSTKRNSAVRLQEQQVMPHCVMSGNAEEVKGVAILLPGFQLAATALPSEAPLSRAKTRRAHQL